MLLHTNLILFIYFVRVLCLGSRRPILVVNFIRLYHWCIFPRLVLLLMLFRADKCWILFSPGIKFITLIYFMQGRGLKVNRCNTDGFGLLEIYLLSLLKYIYSLLICLTNHETLLLYFTVASVFVIQRYSMIDRFCIL